jgi:hypothetical protein
MANQKAVLTKYIRVKKGWRYVRVTLHKNGTVKGVLVGGQEQPVGQYPEGQYQVKTYIGTIRCTAPWAMIRWKQSASGGSRNSPCPIQIWRSNPLSAGPKR